MKMNYSLFFILLTSFRFVAQTTEKQEFNFNQKPLNQVLKLVEKNFFVKYNFLDSLVQNKKVTLRKDTYSLLQINREIEFQCEVVIKKIDPKYYVLTSTDNDACAEKVECLAEVIVNGYLTKGIYKNTDKTIVYPENMEILPGVPDADVLLTLQQLPGVTSPNETASGLHIRGGNIDQNLLLWDGIRMLHPGHLFGMISGFNPSATHQVGYYFKGTPPRMGERISSVIEMKTSHEISSKTIAKMGVNGLNFDFLVRSPIIKNRFGIELSGRKSYTEWWQTPTFIQLSKKVFQNTNLNNFEDENQFKFNDFSGKINIHLRPQTEIYLSSILINNDLDYTTPYLQTHSKNDKMQILNWGGSLQWNEKWNEKWHQNLLFYYSFYDFNYQNTKNLDADFKKFNKLNRSKNSGVEFNFKHFFNKANTWEMGYHLLGEDISHAFSTENINFSLVLDNKHFFNVTHVVYFLEKWHKNRWDIQGGWRFNSYQNIHYQTFEPRLLIQYRISNIWSAQLTYEQKSQLMSQIQESVASDLSLENYVWVLANKIDIPLVQSQQMTVGGTFKKNNWMIDIDAYHKPIKGISSFFYGFYNQFNAEIRNGKGFANGLDLLIQNETKTWKTTWTYSYLKARNKFESINNNQYFPINSEIEHSLSMNITLKWQRLALATGWNWHTGKPYSTLNNENRIIAYNSQRLPHYHRLDISGNYALKNTEKMKTTIGFSVYNLYNRKNALSKEWQGNYTSLESIYNANLTNQDYSGLEITPNLFLKIQF